jgi:hypothetical protein
MALVTVGCKLPNGIILELGDKRVTLNGINSTEIIGGHGITDGVDKEFMDTWLARNKDLSTVKRGFIFCHEKANDTRAEAKDRKNESTGLEPMNPKKLKNGLTALTN